MALIKCNECGKEISDKATICIHCGCPVELKIKCFECGKEIKSNDKICKNCGCPITKITTNERIKNNTKEYNIISTELDIKKINKIRNIIVGILSVIIGITILGNFGGVIAFLNGYYYMAETKLLILLIVCGVCGVLIFLVNAKFSKYKQCNLTLTNNRIKGRVYRLLNSIEINFPLDKVNSIMTTNELGIDGLSLSSSISRTHHLFFVKNADEFKERVMEELNK